MANHENVMTLREMCGSDLSACFEIEPRHLGAEIAGCERALEAWRSLVRNRSFNSVVIESAGPNHARRIIACGASVFVTADFATRELEHPKPYLNSRIIASAGSRDSVVLPEAEICRRGNRQPVDLVILSGNYLETTLSQKEIEAVQVLLPFTFMEAHTGYDLNRILIEWTGETQRLFHHSSGVFRAVETFAPGDRGLYVLTRKEAFAVSGSVATALFQYQEPVLDLRDSDKHLLAEALRGGTDSELAARMNLSLPSIKKRWLSLFQRVSEVRPQLLPGGNAARSEFRGPQKRHHILAYVRTHPQEIRPFRWFSGGLTSAGCQKISWSRSSTDGS